MVFGFIFYILVFYLFILISITFLKRFLSYKTTTYIITVFLSLFSLYLSYNVLRLFILSYDYVLKWDKPFGFLNFLISLNITPISYSLTILILDIGIAINVFLIQYLGNNIKVEPWTYKFNYLTIKITEHSLFLSIHWLIFSIIMFILSNNLITLSFSWFFINMFLFFFINIFVKYAPKLNKEYIITNGYKLMFFFTVLFFTIVIFSCNKYGVDSVFSLNTYFIDKNVSQTHVYDLKKLFTN